MEKFSRAENSSKADDSFGKNEIRVTTQGKMRRYISYATNLLTDQNEPVDHITLKAMGKAINKTVAIAEIIKRRIPGLHQITEIDSTDIKEKYTPNEEGLDVVETTRHVSSIQISLFTHPPETTSVGYQPPIDSSEVKPLAPRRPKAPRVQQQSPDDQSGSAPPAADNAPPHQISRGPGRGRGRGRRGGRGRNGPRQGQGFQQNFPPQENYQQGGGFGGRGYSRPPQDFNQQGGYGGQYGGSPGYHRGGRRGGYGGGGRRGGYGGGRRQNIQQPQQQEKQAY